MFTKQSRNNAGFSLPELIIGIVIVGIAFVAAMYAHAQIQSQGVQVESTLRATSLANSIMRVIRANDFDEHQSPPWSVVLGPEEGSSSQYDDVDDYAGHDWQSYLAEQSGYSASSRVFYVDPSANWLDSSATPTSYKRIVVSVNHGALPSPVVLSSLTTPRSSEED